MQCSNAVRGYIIQTVLHNGRGHVACKGCQPDNGCVASKEGNIKLLNQTNEKSVLSTTHI